MKLPVLARDRRGWFTVFVLSALQALSQSGQTLVMTVTALTGAYLADNAALSTVPLTLQFLGTMAATVPASLMMGRMGRRAGFCAGQAIGAVSALIAACGVLQGNFWLFAAGSIGVGVHNAFWQFLRFAATEAVGTDNRAKAVSFVVMGGVIAALLGPWLATHSRELFAPAMFAGCYVALSGVCAVNILLLQLAQFDKTIATTSTGNGRPLRAIVRQPTFVTAAMSAAIGYGVMILVMTATPLAIVGCGFTFTDAAFVIQWHVAGMYAPSFLTGRLIDRFGAERVIGTGVLLIVATMCANLSGLALMNFWVGLVCLGVGWNFMYVGGSTLLTQAWRPQERARVQALNEFLVFTVVAAASLSSGILFSAVGWHTVNAVLAIPLLIVLLVLSRPILQQKFAARLTTN